ncbi:MAG TPA: hypothetical protein VG125_13695 [Pirellulales bacterium]|jgi:hypothetical protein|nr:hypothetical protein [Pirellulales bacterium]
MNHPSRLRRGFAAAPLTLLVWLLLPIAASLSTAAQAGADEKRERLRAQLLEQMRARAEATSVRFQQGERQPKLTDAPVFRYDDQPRHFIDATMWVWTDRGRPVAFEKIEAMTRGKPEWGHCFTSVAEDLLTVKWDDGREFHSTAPGVEFLPLSDAPPVPAQNAARKLAARRIVRDFSARILTDDSANTWEEMRLLPTPILEYRNPESNEYLGAVFGLTTNGTNPDLLILLEPRDADRKPVWHYGIGRMTIGGVTLKYAEKTVWQVDYYPPRPTAFPSWTFFYTRREEPSP